MTVGVLDPGEGGGRSFACFDRHVALIFKMDGRDVHACVCGMGCAYRMPECKIAAAARHSRSRDHSYDIQHDRFRIIFLFKVELGRARSRL